MQGGSNNNKNRSSHLSQLSRSSHNQGVKFVVCLIPCSASSLSPLLSPLQSQNLLSIILVRPPPHLMLIAPDADAMPRSFITRKIYIYANAKKGELLLFNEVAVHKYRSSTNTKLPQCNWSTQTLTCSVTTSSSSTMSQDICVLHSAPQHARLVVVGWIAAVRVPTAATSHVVHFLLFFFIQLP